MAWNEPGSGGGGKDPWGPRKPNGEGPPDLDEVARKLRERFGALFGGKRGGSSSGMPSASGLGGLALLAIVIWVASGIYIIDPAERGVELRFGKYTVTTLPGPHWHWPYPIETREVVNVDQIGRAEIGTSATAAAGSLILTKDENIVDIKLAVQYKIKDAPAYLFNVSDPDATLTQITESAVREIVGKTKMDLIITEGRKEIEPQLEKLIQETLDSYGTGLQLTSVNMQAANAPVEVRDAFLDVNRSREDEQRVINEAQTYANGIVPVARGAAARQQQEAEAYKAKVIAQAEGEASRFTQVLAEYSKAPAVTRERLYLDAMESVLSNAGKVMVDVKGSNNLLYLPLDRMSGATGLSADKALERMLPSTGSLVPQTQESQDSTAPHSDARERSRDRGER